MQKSYIWNIHMEATFSPSYCLEKKHKMKGKERNQKTIEQQTFPENKPNSVKISKDPRKRKPESQMKREKKKSWCVDQGRSRLFFVATPSPPFHLTLTLRLAKGIENHRPSLSLSLSSLSISFHDLQGFWPLLRASSLVHSTLLFNKRRKK